MKDKIVLNSEEQRRLLVLNQLEAGVLSAAQAGQLQGLAERQLRRLRAGYRQEGASALAHGNRGKRPVNAVDLEVAQRVVELAQTTYLGFNQQHLTEMLSVRLSTSTSACAGGRRLVPSSRRGFEASRWRPSLKISVRARESW